VGVTAGARVKARTSFLQKRSKKLFDGCRALNGHGSIQIESFLLLFFKKEALPSVTFD
jgi:hypothetical protein